MPARTFPYDPNSALPAYAEGGFSHFRVFTTVTTE